MATSLETPLIVITGPTASGKTDIAIKLALEFGGEIVCADSRTVYKGLDIGTAKPTPEEQARVPHHLLDMVEPDEVYNLARFQADAQAAIADIRKRGKIPFLVGGSGLYVDSIVLEYGLSQAPDATRRAELEAMTLEQLSEYSTKHNIKLPDNFNNKRYVIRAIEQNGINTARLETPRSHTYVVAIATDSEVLKQRIQHRSEAIFNRGVVNEAAEVAAIYDWDIAPLQSPAYKASRRLLSGEITQNEAVQRLAHDDWRLARKQMTWMRRNSWITWLDLEHVEAYVRPILTQPPLG